MNTIKRLQKNGNKNKTNKKKYVFPAGICADQTLEELYRIDTFDVPHFTPKKWSG